jgi:hypothetical protein
MVQQQFIKTTASTTAARSIAPALFGSENGIKLNNRPNPAQHNFQSNTVAKTIKRMNKVVRDPELHAFSKTVSQYIGYHCKF